MARHRPSGLLVNSPAPIRALSLAERSAFAKEKLDSCSTIAESCYWQGALDALDAFSSGGDMPEGIGQGVAR